MLKRTKHGFLSHWGTSSQHNRKYSDSDILNMKNRRLNGETFQSIANTYGVNRGTIRNVIQRHNPIIDNTPIPKGYIPLMEYCEKYNVPYNSLYWHIRQGNINTVKIRNIIYLDGKELEVKRLSLPEDTILAILDLYDSGMNKTKIAKQLGISRITVRRYINSGLYR